MLELEQPRAKTESFECVQLAKMKFSSRVINHRLFNGHSVGNDESSGKKKYFIRIYLKEEPTAEDALTLPNSFEGISVRYEISKVHEPLPTVLVR